MPKIIYLLLLITFMNFSTTGAGIHDEYTTLLSEKTKLSSSDDEEPHSIVARNRGNYEKLRKAHPKLPKAETINFRKYAVVAVYSQLPTPCHSLSYSKTPGKLQVSVKRPPPDVMCAQVESSIFEIKLIPALPNEKIKVVFLV